MLYKCATKFDRSKQSQQDSKDRLKPIRPHKGVHSFWKLHYSSGRSDGKVAYCFLIAEKSSINLFAFGHHAFSLLPHQVLS